MRILLILNTLFELAVAIAAAVVLDNLILAGNAIGLTTLSALMLRMTTAQQLRPGLITFAVFHTAITLAWIVTALQTGTFNPATVGHGLFAVAFWAVVLRQR